MQASTTVVSDTKGWRELKEEQDERIKEKREQEEIREKDRVSEDAVLQQKERLEDVYYSKFELNI